MAFETKLMRWNSVAAPLFTLSLVSLPQLGFASDITCSMSGTNDYSEFSTYTSQETRNVSIVMSLDTQETDGATQVIGYTTDYIDYAVQAAGIRLLNSPEVTVSDKWIVISESNAISEVENVVLTMYQKRVRINRYSGVATFSMSIWDEISHINIGDQTVRRTQEVNLQGTCSANSARRF